MMPSTEARPLFLLFYKLKIIAATRPRNHRFPQDDIDFLALLLFIAIKTVILSFESNFLLPLPDDSPTG